MNQITEKMSTTKNYSVNIETIGRVKDLAIRFSVSEGAVVRKAVEVLYELVEVDASLFAEKESDKSPK